MADKLMVHTTLRMAKEQRDKLLELGGGNASAGFRALYAQVYRAPKFVDGRTVGAKEVAPVQSALPVGPRRGGYVGKK